MGAAALVVPAVLSAISLGLQVWGTSEQYKANKEGAAAAKESSEAQRRYYAYLASNAEAQANEVEEAAWEESAITQDQFAEKSREQRSHERGTMASQRAALASAGDFGSVTSQDITTDTLNKSEMDQAVIKYNADATRWNAARAAKSKALNLRRQAQGYRMGGANAVAAGNIAADAYDRQANITLITGASQIAGSGVQLYKYFS